MKSDREARAIRLDSETTLEDLPDECWDYRLGNPCGIDWVPRPAQGEDAARPTIREHFNTYRFADHKEKVADLLPRIARVSVETMEITAAMREARERSG